MKYCIAYPLVTWLFDNKWKRMRKQSGRQSTTRVNEAVAMATQPHIYANVVNFDTDSHAIGLDKLRAYPTGSKISTVQ